MSCACSPFGNTHPFVILLDLSCRQLDISSLTRKSAFCSLLSVGSHPGSSLSKFILLVYCFSYNTQESLICSLGFSYHIFSVPKPCLAGKTGEADTLGRCFQHSVECMSLWFRAPSPLLSSPPSSPLPFPPFPFLSSQI